MSVPHVPLCYWVKKKKYILHTVQLLYIMSPLRLKKDLAICH